MSEIEEKTKSFILEYETGLSKKDKDICEKKLRIGRQIYNACLSECLRRIHSYKSDLQFQKTAEEYRTAKTEGKATKIKQLNNKLNNIKKKHNWAGEYCLNDFRTKQAQHFSGGLSASMAIALSNRAYRAARYYEKGEAKKVHFVKDYEDFSIEGVRNKDGIYFRNGMICFDKNTRLPLKMRDNTPKEYYEEALNSRIKYCRLLSRTIRGKKRYYVQLILEGTPPNHRKYGDGNIVIEDVGLSHAVLSINGKNRVIDLAPEISVEEEKELDLLKKMDYSRRATNPNNYFKLGAIIAGANEWNYSNNYIKLRNQYKELRRKEKATRLNSHGKLTNELLEIGSNISIKNQSYKSYVKMNHDITSHGASKNQNKLIKHKAPGEFVKLLDRKLKYINKELVEEPKKKK